MPSRRVHWICPYLPLLISRYHVQPGIFETRLLIPTRQECPKCSVCGLYGGQLAVVDEATSPGQLAVVDEATSPGQLAVVDEATSPGQLAVVDEATSPGQLAVVDEATSPGQLAVVDEATSPGQLDSD